MKPQPKLFDRAAPCSKRDLWACFRGPRGFREVQVDEAHAVIGLNAPRYMEQKELLVRVKGAGRDSYQLTAAGEDWLMRGIQSYVKNHPSEAVEIPYLRAPSRGRRVRRTGRG